GSRLRPMACRDNAAAGRLLGRTVYHGGGRELSAGGRLDEQAPQGPPRSGGGATLAASVPGSGLSRRTGGGAAGGGGRVKRPRLPSRSHTLPVFPLNPVRNAVAPASRKRSPGHGGLMSGTFGQGFSTLSPPPRRQQGLPAELARHSR